MPPVKLHASTILNEYGKAQSELIGKTVILTDGKTVILTNYTGFGFQSKVMTEDGRSQPSSSRRTRPSHPLRTTPIARYFRTFRSEERGDPNKGADI
ncbi:hypothetical protein ABIB94_008088 [Bradyrhizobium sp. JR7.2]